MPFGAPIPSSDLNGDGLTDQHDLLEMLMNMDTSPDPGMHGDLDGDGAVSVADLVLLITHFGLASEMAEGGPHGCGNTSWIPASNPNYSYFCEGLVGCCLVLAGPCCYSSCSSITSICCFPDGYEITVRCCTGPNFPGCTVYCPGVIVSAEFDVICPK